ncbi:hypothetical protein XacyCFBP1159_20995 [Xanthomonas arboricola pv. corylina]|nr:hypothetical protein XacyCFBP1159_20995 [Xanthomonas arboricola pv. corylina]
MHEIVKLDTLASRAQSPRRAPQTRLILYIEIDQKIFLCFSDLIVGKCNVEMLSRIKALKRL